MILCCSWANISDLITPTWNSPGACPCSSGQNDIFEGPQQPECSPGRSFLDRFPPLSPSLCAASASTWGPGDGGACSSPLSVSPPCLCSSHLHGTPELTRRELQACSFKTPPSKEGTAHTDTKRILGLGIKDMTGLGPSPNAKYTRGSC